MIDKEILKDLVKDSRIFWIEPSFLTPPEDEEVLVYDKQGYIRIAFLTRLYPEDQPEWVTEEYIPIEVTHWMPLPQPPKQDSN